MNKAIPSILLQLSFILSTQAITVLGWTFGTSCDLTSTTTANGLVMSTASRGDGIGENSNGTDCIQSGCFGSAIGGSSMGGNSENEAVEAFDYFEFPVIAAPNGTVTITGISFSQRRSGTGPTNLAIYVGEVNEGYGTTTETSCDQIIITFNSGPFTINPNNTVLIRIYAWGASSGSGTLRIDDVEIEGEVSLPIELTTFTVTDKNQEAHLSWQTATETNNDYFTIQHSTNGRRFTDLATVAGAGDSYVTNSYSYIHQNPVAGRNYYRLQQVDFDGSFSFSQVISVEMSRNELIRIYPTVVPNRLLTIELEELPEEPGEAAIFDISGGLRKIFRLQPDQNRQELRVDDLSPGRYFLRVVTNDLAAAKKFVIP